MSTKTTNLKLFKYDKVVDVDKYVDIDEGFNNNWDKIDEVVGKNTTAISTIEKKNTTQDEQLIQLEKEKAVLQEQVTLLDKNQLSGVAEGESITVKDSSDYYASIGVEGNDKQETRSGSNLFNFNKTQNSKVTVNNDGTLTINGTGGFGLNFVDTVFKQATKYYINYQVVSGTVTNPTSAGEIICSISGTYLKPNTFNEYTPAEDTTRASLWIHKDAVFTNAVIKIWCNTDKSDFEQYGAMPSIDYPSEVQAVGDNINEFDFENFNSKNSNVDYTKLSNESFKLTANSVTEWYYYLTTWRIDNVKKNVALSWKVDELISTTNARVLILAYDSNNNEITMQNNYIDCKATGSYSLKRSLPKNTSYIKVNIYINAGSLSSMIQGMSITISEFKLVKGTKTGGYSEYGQGSMTVKKSNKNILDSKLMIGTSSINFIDFKLKPNTYYTFSSNIPKTYDGSNAFIFATNKAHGYTTSSHGVWVGQTRKVLSDSEGYISLGYRKDNNISSFNDYWYQIEEGEVATDIIPHQEETYILPIQQPMLQGNYFDLVNKKEVHNIKELVLTGDESNWEIYIQNGIVQFFNKSLIKTKSQFGICTHFNATSIAPIYVKEDIGKILMYRTLVGFGIFLDVTEFPTLDVFKERLRAEYTKGTPVKLYYDSTTPTELDLTEEQIAVLEKLQNTKTYKNVTHVDSDDIAILKLDYKKDTETVVNDMQAQIDEIKTLLSTTSTSALLLDNMQTDLESEV